MIKKLVVFDLASGQFVNFCKLANQLPMCAIDPVLNKHAKILFYYSLPFKPRAF